MAGKSVCMTRRNMSWSGNGGGNPPFFLKPAGKDYLWGGSRLNDDFAKGIDLQPLAETWECSTHPDGVSTVASGEFTGMPLAEVLERHPEFLGTHPGGAPGLPILIKFIDAKQDLSVQVHPTDGYAREHEGGQLGKTEMWYVLDAAKGASVVYGFCRDVGRDAVRKSIEDGAVEKLLQRIPVKKDDVFYIQAGTVHAVGAGVLLAEVQESSNLTYRMYDYGRVDKTGKRRPLHVEKALEVADLKGSPEPRQPMRVLRFRRGYATDLLCRCKYFMVERMLLNTECCRELARIRTGGNSFQVLLCMEGCGVVSFGEGRQADSINFYRGDCMFLPADSLEVRIHGKAQMLKVEC